MWSKCARAWVMVGLAPKVFGFDCDWDVGSRAGWYRYGEVSRRSCCSIWSSKKVSYGYLAPLRCITTAHHFILIVSLQSRRECTARTQLLDSHGILEIVDMVN